MTVPLRTVLRWLDEQWIQDEAECWVLDDRAVLPITTVTSNSELGDILLCTSPIWTNPAPVPLTYDIVRDTILECYSGAGQLQWPDREETTYRGSYVVNPESAVFFIFLPNEVEIIETHEEKMEKRKKQARELTQEIERNV